MHETTDISTVLEQADTVDEPGAPAAEPDLTDPALYLNRELSWLDFNKRVLAQAFDETKPLLERIRMLAISGSNLDEFYMIRESGLQQQVQAGVDKTTPDGRTPKMALADIDAVCIPLHARMSECYRDVLRPLMQEHGFAVLDRDELEPEEREWLRDYFRDHLFPVLTPLAVDPAHPFPYISNLSLNLAVTIRDPVDEDDLFARVKVPGTLSRFIRLPGRDESVPLEQVVAANIDLLFPGMEVVATHPFRVIRDADIEIEEDEAEDLLHEIESRLQTRRFRSVVSLEVNPSMPKALSELLVRELEMSADDLVEIDGLLGLADLWDVLDGLERPSLDLVPWKPRTPPQLATVARGEESIFERIRAGDILVHHPYDSFTASTERFILDAVEDPKVLAVKQTLYRTTENSEIMEGLIRAAEAGKQVVACIEIKARFDEERNIQWARRLEASGAHVVYGLLGLKTHAKACLVVRDEADGVRRYCHLGTGNYNARTARLYEDFGLLSCRPELGADVSELFNFLTGYSRQRGFRMLKVAPFALRDTLVERIRREVAHARAGRAAAIRVKVNSLVDPALIQELYRASDAGVDIDLVVRGICCLRPGIPGISEKIRVRSVIGRFLEHSRIFHFHDDGADEILIGSADWMPRNLDRRVESVVPVQEPELRDEVSRVLDLCLADNQQAWELCADGTWERVAGGADEPPVATHQTLLDLAKARG